MCIIDPRGQWRAAKENLLTGHLISSLILISCFSCWYVLPRPEIFNDVIRVETKISGLEHGSTGVLGSP